MRISPLPAGTTLGGGRYVIGAAHPRRGGFSILYDAADTYFPGRASILIKELAMEAWGLRNVKAHGAQLNSESACIAWDAVHEADWTVERRRFIRESGILLRLRSLGAHVTPVIDHWQEVHPSDPLRWSAFYAMERLEGGQSLAEWASWNPQQPSPVCWPELEPVATKLLAALEGVHRESVLHCDLKPQNVIISKAGDVYLIDFGTARVAGMHAPMSRSTLDVMTEGFSPPEQVMGGELSFATDLYAFAMTLYALLTGRAPAVRAAEDNAKWVDRDMVLSDLASARCGHTEHRVPEHWARAIADCASRRIAERPQAVWQVTERLTRPGLPRPLTAGDVPDWAKRERWGPVVATVHTMDELVAALNAAPPYRMIQLDAGGRFEGSNPITIEKAVALVGVDGRARISIATEKVGIVVKAPAYFENAEIHATLSPRGDAISAHDQCVLDHCQVSVTCRREGTQGIDAVFVHRSQLFANECHLATLVGPGRVRVVGGHVARATVSGHYEDVDLGELASSHRREITVSCGAIKKLYAGEGRVRIVGTAAIQNITVDDDANIWLEACTVGEDPNARYAMSVNAHLYYDAACKFGPNRENKLADFAYGARAWEMADALIEEQEP